MREGSGRAEDPLPMHASGGSERLGVTPDAPIVPGQGLGGLGLRVRVGDLAPLLDRSYLETHGSRHWYELVDRYEARYWFGPIGVGVDVHNGKVFKLIATEGYDGALLGSIRVGMNAGEAMVAEPRLYHDEAEGLLFVRDHPGVALELAIDDPLADEVAAYPIAAITVFAPEVWTPRGMRGEW